MGLTFLTPLFLYGALGALVPLLLHLIKRQRARLHVFSTLRFLKISQKAVVRQQRLRRLLLLLLRMAACAVLAMIFARPFLKDMQNVKGQNFGLDIKNKFYKKAHNIKKTSAIIIIKIRTPNK